MIKQAVQTLTGRGGSAAEDSDPYYLSDDSPAETQTQPDEDGTNNNQDDQQSLQTTVDRLVRDYDTLNQRLSDKDRHIGRLERENQILAAQRTAEAGRQPSQEPDPVLDESTATLFAEKYKENPEQALIALAEHLDRRNQDRDAVTQAQRDRAQQITTKLQAVERNILRQVDLAMKELGPDAEEVVGDFINIVQSGTGSAEDYAGTWLGQQLQRDRALAETTQGVYLLIEREAARRQGNAGQQAPDQSQSQPAQRSQISGVMRPQAASRSVHQPVDGSADEVPVEDRIADAIVNAQRGDEAQQKAIFHG